MSTVNSESQSLSPTALIELFELDTTNQGGTILRFHSGVNELGNDVVWQGNTYSRFPIEASGFDRRSNGTLPRPVVKASNIQGILGSDARSHGDYAGCKFTRRRTFARFLDAVNFPSGNPSADPNQHYPDEIYYVDRKSKENSAFVEFELASAFDLHGVQLPRRQVIQNCCSWVYRGAECGYAGGAVATESGTATSNAQLDKCGKRISDCKLRFGANGILNYGGFPAVGLIR
jgi:lambda family phage minor tail protein L